MLDRWLTRRRLVSGVLSAAVLAACGVGVGLTPIPLTDGLPGAPMPLPDGFAIAAVVAADGDGFVLGRDGDVLRLGADGSVTRTAVVGPYMTPFGALVDGRVVFGGLRCDGDGCRARVGEVVTLDRTGRVAAVTAVVRSERRPSRLNGLALVGTDGGTVWVNGGDALAQIDPDGRVAAEVPWPGGEPCLVGGVLHDLSAVGRLDGGRGEELPSDETFRLRLRAWDGGAWRRVAGGGTRMRHGRNAYCAPGGYEIRDARSVLARWTPDTGWRRAGGATGATGAARDIGAVGPVTASTGRRYVPAADGVLFDVTDPGSPRPTGLALAGLAASAMPPAVQVDDAGGSLVACGTTYRGEEATTRCALAPKRPAGGGRAAAAAGGRGAAPARPDLLAGPRPAADADRVHHYNMCSAACGSGARAHTRDVVSWLVGRYRPAALSLNEACYDDGVQLAGRWPEGFGAGTGFVALARAVNCPGAVKRMGNQVVVAGAGAGDAAGDPAGAWAELPSAGGRACASLAYECRGLACAEARPAGGDRFSACTAHLEPPRGDPSVTEAQARAYLDAVLGRSRPGVATVVAGDFNLARDTVDGWFADAGLRATPVGSTMVGRDGGGDEIDAIYQSAAGSSSPPSSSSGPARGRYCDRQASDHCYLTATGPGGPRPAA